MAGTAAPPRPPDQVERGPAYDEDFFLLKQRQAALIRAAISRDEYPAAREAASAETGFVIGTFPRSLPYTPEQILDDDFYLGPIDEP